MKGLKAHIESESKEIIDFWDKNPSDFGQQVTQQLKNLTMDSFWQSLLIACPVGMKDSIRISYDHLTKKIRNEILSIVRESFNNTQRLYHYTSFESACKILGSQKLRFSRLGKMNDLTESHKVKLYDSVGITDKKNKESQNEIQEDIDSFMSNLSQLSLSLDKPNKSGYEILPMWGHYANSGSGVCFVFDKQKMIEQMKKVQGIICHDRVKYNLKTTTGVSENEFFESKKSPQKLRAFCKNNFFSKTSDWKYEQEYRALAKSDKELFLDVNNCIHSIIMYDGTGNLQKRTEYKALKMMVGLDIPIFDFDIAFGDARYLFSNENRLLWPIYDYPYVVYPYTSMKEYELDL